MTGNRAYIEIVNSLVACRKDLTEADLRHIGDFTIWRVAQWMYDKGYYGVYGMVGFHAVCGDIDIPWTSEEAKSMYAKYGRWNLCAKCGLSSLNPIHTCTTQLGYHPNQESL
jgi:hypothetical protein